MSDKHSRRRGFSAPRSTDCRIASQRIAEFVGDVTGFCWGLVVAVRLSEERTRVSNGKSLLLGNADGQSRVARRFANIYRGIASDLGGEEQLTERNVR